MTKRKDTSNRVRKKNDQPVRQKREKNDGVSGIEVVLEALFNALGKTSKWVVIGVLGLVIIVAAIGYYIFVKATDANANIKVEQRIDLTPTQITAMRRIGQWEFLSVADEELVDTVRPGLFVDDELIRIYYGTLRLGFDMNDVNEKWIKHDEDTLVVTLPAIRLLDEHFIDEARTNAFFEKGKWNDKDREAMYQRAHYRMKVRSMNKANVESAEQNASRQFQQMLRSMGFEHVKIRFEQ